MKTLNVDSKQSSDLKRNAFSHSERQRKRDGERERSREHYMQKQQLNIIINNNNNKSQMASADIQISQMNPLTGSPVDSMEMKMGCDRYEPIGFETPFLDVSFN